MTTIAPPPASLPEQRLDAGAAERFGRVPVSLPGTAWDADLIPAPHLATLAWALSLDEWNPAWDDMTKRRAIRDAIDAHKLKGTAAGVKGVLDRIGAQYDYIERPTGAPFTASVIVRNSGTLQISDAVTVEQLVVAHKRESVHMVVTFEAGLRGEVLVAGGIGAALIATFTLDARA